VLNSIKEFTSLLLNKSEKLSHIAVLISGILLFASVAIVSFEVIMRKLFSYSIGGADEISSYILIISSTWAFSYALFHKAHIRIDLLYEKFNIRIRAFLDVLSLVFLMIFIFPLSYYAFGVLRTTLEKGSTANTPLQTPLWIPQSLWFIGLVGFSVIIALFFINALAHFLSNDFEGLGKWSGVTTLKESIEEESGISIDTVK